MDPHPLSNLFKRPNYDEPIASKLSALDYLYEVLFENHESENFDEVLKEEIYKVIHDSSLIEKHDCNVASMNSLNIHDANDMQSHKLGDAVFDEDDIFTPPSLDANKFAYVESNKKFMLVGHEKNDLCDSYIVEFLHDATENYYEGGTYACRNCTNIKFPLYVFKVLKLGLFCLPMLVDSCSHKLFAHKIPMHRKLVILKCACHKIHDALLHVSITTSYVSIIEITMPS